MPFIKYKDHRFSKKAQAIITIANAIITEYQEQGYELTLRQLYYQFVARDYLPNNMRSYKNLGGVINDARLAGLIDWNSIVDRTRNLRSITHWDSPEQIISSAISSYKIDMWENQPFRVEVWIEKDALVGVIEGVCNKYDVPFFSCRGYTSQSELWGAARRFNRYIGENQEIRVLHLGDHDPSGIDMSRDIIDRLRLFSDDPDVIELERLGLHHEQVLKYKLPPNPAKMTDSRAKDYIRRYGRESWELDALSPSVITNLIEARILRLIDQAAWSEREDKQEEEVKKLKSLLKRL